MAIPEPIPRDQVWFPKRFDAERFDTRPFERLYAEYEDTVSWSKETFDIRIFVVCLIAGLSLLMAAMPLLSSASVLFCFVCAGIFAIACAICGVGLYLGRKKQRASRLIVNTSTFEGDWGLLCQIKAYEDVLGSLRSLDRYSTPKEPHLIAVCQEFSAWREDLLKEFAERFSQNIATFVELNDKSK